MDEQDFSSIYERYSRDVYRFALYLSGDAALAQDITAETFARAWAVHDGIRVGSVKAYLLMIARNLFRDGRRRPVQVQLPDFADVRDGAASPEAAAEARQDLRSVLGALRALPELDRAILLMATLEGLSHEAVGAAVGLSTAAVKVRVHRARVTLNAARAAGKTLP